jgi:hypothetical protein
MELIPAHNPNKQTNSRINLCYGINKKLLKY